ncbi:ion channel [Streptomyces longwoodensis]|uniref:ion channel n=1 Tax=Streptomyces longwoodensis TaxID=68231 RepID=UPI0032565C06
MARGNRLTCGTLVGLPFALFYLFIFPVMVAGKPEPGIGGIAIAAFSFFLVFQCAILASMLAGESVCALYGKYPRALRVVHRLFGGEDDPRNLTAGRAAVNGLLAYAISTYMFSVAYLFVSQRQPGAFGVGKLTTFDSFYYGISTALTYSDLQPVSVLGKALVLIQILVGFVFALFLFSVIAGSMQPTAAAATSSSRPERANPSEEEGDASPPPSAQSGSSET